MYCLIPGHFLDAVCSVVFVVHVTGHVFEVVHVWADQHVPQLHKVAVRLVLHWRDRKERCETLQPERFNIQNVAKKKRWFLPSYLQRFPRDTASLAPSGPEPPPLCCCRSRRTACTPVHKQTCQAAQVQGECLISSGNTTDNPGFTLMLKWVCFQWSMWPLLHLVYTLKVQNMFKIWNVPKTDQGWSLHSTHWEFTGWTICFNVK